MAPTKADFRPPNCFQLTVVSFCFRLAGRTVHSRPGLVYCFFVDDKLVSVNCSLTIDRNLKTKHEKKLKGVDNFIFLVDALKKKHGEPDCIVEFHCR